MKCPKCGNGELHDDSDITHGVAAGACLICGYRHYPDYPRRRPTLKDQQEAVSEEPAAIIEKEVPEEQETPLKTEEEEMAGHQICAHEGCDKFVVKDRLCVAHYKDAHGEHPKPRCTVEGCDKNRHKDNMCYHHWREAQGLTTRKRRSRGTGSAAPIAPAPKAPPIAVKLPITTVTLNFAEYPELYKKFAESAKKNFRTPELHAYYILSTAFDLAEA